MASKCALVAWTTQLLLLGCAPALGPAPSVTRVDPAAVSMSRSTRVQVVGENFTERLDADYTHPSHSGPQGGFTLELIAGSLSVPLEGASFVNATELSATVAANTPAGSYALRVTDPWGRQTTLANALAVVDGCVTDLDCEDGLACTLDVCEAAKCQHAVESDQCLIAGACYQSGQSDPQNACQSCDPATSNTRWTPRHPGNGCGNGSP